MTGTHLRIGATLVLLLLNQLIWAQGGRVALRLVGTDNVTNQREITLSVLTDRDPNLIGQMKVALEKDFEEASWQPYKEKLSFTLPDENGDHILVASLKDKAGNVSQQAATTVVLDRTPPQVNYFEINRGQITTNNKNLRVRLFFEVDDAQKMQISNSSGFSGKWQEYEEQSYWKLGSAGDGPKVVWARFMDRAGNIGETVQDTIFLDTTPPENCSVVINDDAPYTNRIEVRLSIKSDDASLVRIVSSKKSEIMQFQPNENNEMEVDWELDSANGQKLVKVYFRDQAGNVTIKGLTDVIILDTQAPPTPFLAINRASKYVTDPDGEVYLAIGTRINPSTIEMAVGNDSIFADSAFRPYTPNIEKYQLESEEDGIKTVYAVFRDEAGNRSRVGRTKVLLDREPPEAISISINDDSSYTTKKLVRVGLEAREAVAYQLSSTRDFSDASPLAEYTENVDSIAVDIEEGPFYLYVKFRDMAGNFSEPIIDSILVDRKAPRGGILANGGSRYVTNSDKIVSLTLKFDSDAKWMQITDVPNFEGVPWQPAKENIDDWKISGDDGPKKIFVRFKDDAGNISKVYAADIRLDRSPPANPSIVINENAEYLTEESRQVRLLLSADEAVKMKISEDSSFTEAQWMDYSTEMDYQLQNPDEEVVVYTKFADAAGNTTKTVYDRIKIDHTPPQVRQFVIENDSVYINQKNGKVQINMDVEGANMMVLSNSPVQELKEIIWEPYSNNRKWVLDVEEQPEGRKTVFARFKDEAGNVTATVSDQIIVDFTPPQNCTFILNGGNKYTNKQDRKVSISIKSESGVDHVQFSNSSDFSASEWLPMTSRIDEWELSSEDGKKNVYARFRDRAGNISKVFSASIILDRKPPDIQDFAIHFDSIYCTDPDRRVVLVSKVTEAATMKIASNNFFEESNWEPYQEKRPWQLSEEEGEKELFAQFADTAGNVSEIISDQIILDLTPPQVQDFSADGGSEWTNDPDKKVTLSLEAVGAFEMKVGSDPSLSESSWQPYRPVIEEYVLPGDDGIKNLYAVFRDEAGNVSRKATTTIKLKREF